MVLLLNVKYLMKPKKCSHNCDIFDIRHMWYAIMHILEIEIASITLAKETPQSILIWQKKGVRCANITLLGSLLKSFPSNREASLWLASQLLAIMMARNFLSSTWFIFPVVFTTQLQRWRESSNKCTDSVNVRVHQAKWMVPSAKWSGTAFCHHSPPIRPSLDPFLLHIFSAEYKLPGNILYFKVLA